MWLLYVCTCLLLAHLRVNPQKQRHKHSLQRDSRTDVDKESNTMPDITTIAPLFDGMVNVETEQRRDM